MPGADTAGESHPATGVVDFIQFVTTTKLAANGVPHQFEDLDALDVIHPVRTAHILRQILVDLRIVQVTGTGREIDQATGNVAFDNVLIFA